LVDKVEQPALVLAPYWEGVSVGDLFAQEHVAPPFVTHPK